MKAKCVCLVSIFILQLFLFNSCNSALQYQTGRDTSFFWGNGRYQLLRAEINPENYIKYSLYDCEKNKEIIEDVYGFVEKNKNIYFFGWNNNDNYYSKYVVINKNDNSIISSLDIEEFSNEEINIFTHIDRFVEALEDRHYTNKFDIESLKFSVCADTMIVFCEGKYQIIRGSIVNQYSYFLYDREHNNSIIENVFGYCEKEDKYYLWGYANGDNYVKRYVTIDKSNNDISISYENELTSDEKVIFNSIEKFSNIG